MAQNNTILIIDDHPLFREGLKTIIARETRYKLVGEAGDGREALRMINKLKPDLVLLDIALPDQTGIRLITEINNISPQTRVMIVSMHSKTHYIIKAFQAGATGYMTKDSASDRLLEGIDTVLRGEYFIDGTVSHKIIGKIKQLSGKDADIMDSAYDTLTDREQEIMVLLAEGVPTRQIGEKLFISPKTVENHRTNIMNKLDLHSPIELVHYAIKLGLIDVDLWED